MVVASRQIRSFQRAVEDQVRLEGLHRHHQGGGSAGEVQGLLVIGHPLQHGLEARGQGLLVAQGLHVVLVVVGENPEAAVAGRLEERLGGQIIPPDLEAHVGPVPLPGRHFRGLNQGAPDAETPGLPGDRDGVEARHRGAPAEQDQHIAQEGAAPALLARVLRQQGAGTRPGHHVAELATGESVGIEALVLEPHQGPQIRQARLPNPDRRRLAVAQGRRPRAGRVWERIGHWLGTLQRSKAIAGESCTRSRRIFVCLQGVPIGA